MSCQIITSDAIFDKQPLTDPALKKAGTRFKVFVGSEDGILVLSHLCQESVF